MSRCRSLCRLNAVCAGLSKLFILWGGMTLGSIGGAHAGSYHAIYVFGPPPDGTFALAGVVADPQGRLYGTTLLGGTAGNGTVFRLTRPTGTGEWTEEVLHNFTAFIGLTTANTEGATPEAPVTLGSDGTVYGTGGQGGSDARGTVFSLANAPNWPVTVLHSFLRDEGAQPNSGLVFGSNGLLYGTTAGVSISTYADTGTVFSVSPLGDRVAYQVVHTFGKAGDATGPVGLTAVPAGYFNGFVGATSSNAGTVYALQINPAGQGLEIPIHAFPLSGTSDLYAPTAPPIVGQFALRNGLYGCAYSGGTHNQGGIYQIVLDRKGGFAETVLYNFGDQPNDPYPQNAGECGIVQGDKNGKLYGTSTLGGAFQAGTFFELDPPTRIGGPWTEKVDVSFNPNGPAGGGAPYGAPLRIGNKFYGTAQTIVYELTP